MKNYYNFMFFSAVCSSFTGTKDMLQNWKAQSNSWKFVRPQKIAELLGNKVQEKGHQLTNTQKQNFASIQPLKNRANIPAFS